MELVVETIVGIIVAEVLRLRNGQDGGALPVPSKNRTKDKWDVWDIYKEISQTSVIVDGK